MAKDSSGNGNKESSEILFAVLELKNQLSNLSKDLKTLERSGELMNQNVESIRQTAISGIKNQITELSINLQSLEKSGENTHESIESMRRDMSGRFNKLENAVFGNEELSKIGLVEKVRGHDEVAEVVLGDEAKGLKPLPERVRNLESGWAKLTTAAVVASTVVLKLFELAWSWIAGMIQARATPHQ